MIDSIRCLALLFTSTKVKNSSGDIPYVIKFVPVSYGTLLLTINYFKPLLTFIDWTPPGKATEKINQPCIIAVEGDMHRATAGDWSQWFQDIDSSAASSALYL